MRLNPGPLQTWCSGAILKLFPWYQKIEVVVRVIIKYFYMPLQVELWAETWPSHFAQCYIFKNLQLNILLVGFDLNWISMISYQETALSKIFILIYWVVANNIYQSLLTRLSLPWTVRLCQKASNFELGLNFFFWVRWERGWLLNIFLR